MQSKPAGEKTAGCADKMDLVLRGRYSCTPTQSLALSRVHFSHDCTTSLVRRPIMSDRVTIDELEVKQMLKVGIRDVDVVLRFR